MTPRRFETLVAAYGADWDRWPEAERPAALALLAADPALRRRWDEARSLDVLLDRAVVPPMSDGALSSLTRTLMDRLPEAPPPRPAPLAPPRGWDRAAWRQSLVGGLTAIATALCLIWAHPLDRLGNGTAADTEPLLVAMSPDGLEDAP
ncbi:hypothetical protein ACM64Y_06535 [Novispirillum sp. DQ9]|uniref:hypothetical protein n=1 Tax=Novispirillum sp. DQ9 TaxID=3398612 RepID=UPI003C79729B